jgi:outer membrane protein assembly factor BamB
MAFSKTRFRPGCLVKLLLALFLGVTVFSVIPRLLHPVIFLTMPDSVVRAYVHAMIRSGIRGHDVVLSLGGVANEDSIPLLISLLPTSPAPERDCAYGHPLETLTRLTNCAPGYDRPSWETWWKSNSAKSLEQIREDSFLEIGLQNPWEKNVHSAQLLMRALVNEQEHWRKVAREQLDTFPEAVLQSASESCIVSPDSIDRLGVLAWLDDISVYKTVVNVVERLDRDEITAQYAPGVLAKREELLRSLTKDSVEVVRASALHKLNKQISLTKTADEKDIEVQQKLFGDRILRVSKGKNASSLFVCYEDEGPRELPSGDYDYGEIKRLALYDTTTGQTDWEYIYPEHILSTPLETADRLFVYLRNSVVALDLSSGEEAWSTSVDSGSGAVVGDKMLLHEDNLILNTTHALLAVSQANGEVIWRVDLKSQRPGERLLQNGAIGYAANHFFVATQDDTLLKVDPQGVVVERHSISLPKTEDSPSSNSGGYHDGVFGVVAQGDTVYIGALLNGTQFLQACSAETLAELWAVVLESAEYSGDLYLAGDKLLCTAPGQLFCVRQETGEIAWIESDPEKSLSAEIYAINERYFLADTVTNGLTVRSLYDGIVLTAYPEHDYVHVEDAVFLSNRIAIGHGNGALWFVENRFVRD